MFWKWIPRWLDCHWDPLTLWSHSSTTEITERTEPTSSSQVGIALSWWLWKWTEAVCNMQGCCTVGLFFIDECIEFVLRTHCANKLNFCGSEAWTATSWSKGSCWDVTPCPLHVTARSTAQTVGHATVLIVLWLKLGEGHWTDWQVREATVAILQFVCCLVGSWVDRSVGRLYPCTLVM